MSRANRVLELHSPKQTLLTTGFVLCRLFQKLYSEWMSIYDSNWAVKCFVLCGIHRAVKLSFSRAIKTISLDLARGTFNLQIQTSCSFNHINLHLPAVVDRVWIKKSTIRVEDRTNVPLISILFPALSGLWSKLTSDNFKLRSLQCRISQSCLIDQ